MSQLKAEHDQLSKPDHKRKLLRIRSVMSLTGISKSYVYGLCRKGLFPLPIELIPGGTSVAWVESEIFDWIDSRISERNSGVKS